MVAVFISENEDTNSLEEVLQQIKSLNPGWQPRNFLVDFSMAEIAAIEKNMPSKFILPFYRSYFLKSCFNSTFQLLWEVNYNRVLFGHKG